MPWVAAVGSVAAAAMAPDPSGTAGGVRSTVQLPDQAGAAQALNLANQNYMTQAGQFYGLDPQYANQAFNAMYNNPYAGGMQTAAGQAGTMAGQFAPQAAAMGQGAFGAGQQALGAGQQVWQTAQDPQNALFNQLQNQVQQQANVTNSQYGLGSSPAGAAAANQALGQFDINWQNQQLARQQQGQQALNAGINAYTGAAQQGLGMGQAGISLQQQAGALPYATAQQIGQGQFGAINQNQLAMQGAMQPYQQNINNLNSYLGLGQAAQAQANQQAYQQQQMQNQQIAGLAQLGTQAYTSYMGQQPQQQPTYDQTTGAGTTSLGTSFYNPSASGYDTTGWSGG